MKFRFRLESILKHRDRTKVEAQRVWSEAQNQVNDCLQEIQDMYSKIDESRKLISDSEKSGVRNQMAVFGSANEFLTGQKIKIEWKRHEARELMQVAEQKRDELIVATQEYEALKKLKERKHLEFKIQVKKKEAKEMDDLVTMRFKRSGT